MFKLLYFGDIFGKAGRVALERHLPKLKEKFKPDAVFANCENAANGRGVSKRVVSELLALGFTGFSSGNHIYDAPDGFSYLQSPESVILRPYNFPMGSMGKGAKVFQVHSGVKVGLINLMGRIHMEPGVDLPFTAFDAAYLDLKNECDVMILDFHAEATSEKKAMGWYVDGKVQLMVGTHTHVPTADAALLPNGTAYITDLGMCGPHDSVIGMDKNIVIARMRTSIPARMEPAEGDPRVQGIYCEIDVAKKRAVHIERVEEK